MKSVKIFFAVAALFLLERVFFAAHLEIFSLCPWLMFVFSLTAAAVSEEPADAIITAGFCGLLADISGGGTAGSAMAVFAVSATVVYYFTSRFFQNSLLIALVAVFVFGLAGEMLYFLLNSRGLENYSAMTAFWSVALPLSAIDTIFSLLMYPVVKKIFAGRRYV
ncbi:MAG: rod shape-determining protein MreD [Clostridia bacterium]|nr:rod shape-determining protein MreD [Clostridia bacterium]